MLITTEDEVKLEIVKDYNPRELRLILDFLECGMFCDYNGQPYTRDHFEHYARNDF